MAVSLKHKFKSQRPDGNDPTVIRPSNWNEEHNVTMDGPRLMGRSAPTPGAVGDVELGDGLEFNGSNLRVAGVGKWNDQLLGEEFSKKFSKTGDETSFLDVTKDYPGIILNRPGVAVWRIHVREDGHLHFFADEQLKAIWQTDGNVYMSGWGYFTDILEERGAAWSNDRISQLQYRLVSEYTTARGPMTLPAGSVVTGFNTHTNGRLIHFYARYLQVFDPVRGWVQFFND